MKRRLKGTHSKTSLPLLLLLGTDPLLLSPLSTALLLHIHAHKHTHTITHSVVVCWVVPQSSDVAFLERLTILLTRAMSSPSSFCLWMKWASIKDCSSVRSFSWRFLWMSCSYRHTFIWKSSKHSLDQNYCSSHVVLKMHTDTLADTYRQKQTSPQTNYCKLTI